MMTAEQRQDVLPAFREGRVVLDCRVACSWQWIARRRMLYSLYATQQWDTLAAQVLEIGYQEDLAYFWLAHAAEGQGLLLAAAKYYLIANRLTLLPDRLVHCNHWIEGCFGIDVRRNSFASFHALQAVLSANNQPPEPRMLPRLSPTAVAIPQAPSRLLEPPVGGSSKVEPPKLSDYEVLVPPIRR